MKMPNISPYIAWVRLSLFCRCGASLTSSCPDCFPTYGSTKTATTWCLITLCRTAARAETTRTSSSSVDNENNPGCSRGCFHISSSRHSLLSYPLALVFPKRLIPLQSVLYRLLIMWSIEPHNIDQLAVFMICYQIIPTCPIGINPRPASASRALLRLTPCHRAYRRTRRAGTSGTPDSLELTGGEYKARERIHRDVADSRLLAIPTS